MFKKNKDNKIEDTTSRLLLLKKHTHTHTKIGRDVLKLRIQVPMIEDDIDYNKMMISSTDLSLARSQLERFRPKFLVILKEK